MRRPSFVLTAVVLGLSLATACSTGSTDKASEKETANGASKAEAGAFPVTIKHRYGTTEVKAEPKRVVTLGSADQDNTLALGVVPVGVPEITWGPNANKTTDWFDEALDALGGERPTLINTADDIPVDEVAALEPDLILASNSGITQAQYDSLSKVAPVVAPTGADWLTPWDDSLEQAGLALGRSAEAKKVEEATENLIDSVEQENPGLENTSFLFAYFDQADLGTVGVYSEDDLRVDILDELGLEVPDVVEKVVPRGAFYGSVSAEKADTLTSDILLTYVETADELKKITDNALLGRIPAVAADKVITLKADTVGVAVSSPTPLSIPVIVEELVPQIVAATK